MITQIIEYIKGNRILILFLIMILIFACHYYFFSEMENFEVGNSDINNYVGQYIHFKYNDIYLGLANLSDCNLKPNPGKECGNNIAILQKNINDNSTFVLNKLLGTTPDTYFISSILNDITPSNAFLSQNLNLVSDTGLMCFDGGSNEATNFEVEETTKGYYLKFKKANVDYYLSEWDIVTCKGNQVKRLCVQTDKKLAIPFTLIISDKQPQKFIPYSESEISIESENFVGNISIDMDSIYSNGTMISLPGAGDLGTYKPWNED